MKAYIVKPGAQVWKFTEESMVEGKGVFETVQDEKMYTDVVFDPVMLANGNALDPELYAEGFPHKMCQAARKGFYVFHEGNYEMTAVHSIDLEVH